MCKISSAAYQDRLNRLKLMIQSATVGLVNSKSLLKPSLSSDDGRAVTLMSTDAEAAAQSATMLHGIWSQAIEVIIGMTMLGWKVGWVWPVPLVIIFCEASRLRVANSLTDAWPQSARG
jgi:ATP-binding cassette, subfamily C (CFTR/MRP), member 1